MSTTSASDNIPPLHLGQLTYYSPADIKRWGVQRFFDTVAYSEPLLIPDLGFTAEENAHMDELLGEERAVISYPY